MNVGSLFSGAGLLDYGLTLAGDFEHLWFAESDEFRRGILHKRWPDALIYDDVTIVGEKSAACVDVIVGGFPCKGVSTAGKRTGFDHPETVLWREFSRIVRELRPRFVVVENVRNILSLKSGEVWGEVLGDLAACGYDADWDVLPAAAVGAPHLRERAFAIATYADSANGERHWRSCGVQAQVPGAFADSLEAPGHRSEQCEPNGRQDARRGSEPATDTSCRGREDGAAEHGAQPKISSPHSDGRGVPVGWGEYRVAIERWERVAGPAPEPLVRRVDDGPPPRVDKSRLSALGDGVQVQCGYLVGKRLLELAGVS